MKKYIVSLFILTGGLNSYSQTIWEANLEPVPEDGYYNIGIDQRLTGASEAGLKDLRIMKLSGEERIETPYFIQPDSPVKEVSSLEDFNLTENTAKDSLNILVVDNKGIEELDRFYLLVGNAEVDVRTSIRGSNDGKQWYIVKRTSLIPHYSGDNGKDKFLILDFPKGNYRYYEVTLVNDQGSPLEVKAVSKLKSTNLYGQFSELISMRNPAVEQKDKKTFIRLGHLPFRYTINKIEFFISNEMEFLRTAALIDTVNHSRESLTLSSRSENSFLTDNIKLGKEGYFVIDNYNNPPLRIDSIKLYGLKRYACAYLEKGGKYYLSVGDSVGLSPNYDIEHFRNDISPELPILSTIDLNTRERAPQEREMLLIENPVFLWSVIIITGLFLIVICIRMIKGMRQPEQ